MDWLVVRYMTTSLASERFSQQELTHEATIFSATRAQRAGK